MEEVAALAVVATIMVAGHSWKLVMLMSGVHEAVIQVASAMSPLIPR